MSSVWFVVIRHTLSSPVVSMVLLLVCKIMFFVFVLFTTNLFALNLQVFLVANLFQQKEFYVWARLECRCVISKKQRF
jgi:transcriptional regulator GlxA family with amidase domain